MPKVSVMMPVYNAEKFLSQALDSILNQDFQDFHVVVSDDASTDRSAEIINKYKDWYPDKITVILNSSNLGVTSNCNLALSQCFGEYISLFAGDDIMLPGKLSKQVELMDKNPDCVLCYHPVEIFDSDTDKTFFITNQSYREDVFSTEDLLLKGGIPGGCSIMVRRNAIPINGYDTRLKTVSDWLFFLEISTQGKIKKIDEVLARYRKHSAGASQLAYSLLEESLYALDIFEEKYPSINRVSSYVRKAKARYIAGEVFRKLMNNPEIALILALDALKNNNNIKYISLYIVAFLNRYLIGVNFLIRTFLPRMKSFIKKFIA